jgi:aminoglycoside 6'-N-acetyltransferase I
MEIRRVRIEDQPEWIRMRVALWPDENEDHEEETKRYFDQAGDSLITFVVDRLDERLGGFIEVALRQYAEGCESSPVAYVEGWYVDTDLRRRGLGAALIAAAEKWARDHGLAEIASDAVLGNEISISAHKALGYKEEVRVVCFRKEL